jgi:hypothetical protein
VREMGDCWPSGVGSRERASNHPVLRWLKTVVVSDRGKAGSIPSGGDQEDVPEALASRFGAGATVEASSLSNDIETGEPPILPGMSLAGTRLLARWCPA